jgi:hypothetical protein
MSSQELASKTANPVPATEGAEETPKASNSLALQLICAVGVLGFSGYMFSTWHQTLVQHSLAQQAQAEAPVLEAAETAPVESEMQAVVTQPEITPNTPAATPTAAMTAETTETTPIAPTPEPVVMEPAPIPAISDPATLTTLGQKLYEQIDSSWQSYPTFSRNLAYQVQVQPDGAIASYDSLNQPAVDYLAETPLPQLISNSPVVSETSTQPQAKFLVLLTPSGTLEISPWVAN